VLPPASSNAAIPPRSPNSAGFKGGRHLGLRAVGRQLLGQPECRGSATSERGSCSFTGYVCDRRQDPRCWPTPIPGFGNAINAMRTVEQLIKAGVGALFIEDQVAPKRCGHVRRQAGHPARGGGRQVSRRGPGPRPARPGRRAGRALRRARRRRRLARRDDPSLPGLQGGRRRRRLPRGADQPRRARVPSPARSTRRRSTIASASPPNLTLKELEGLNIVLVVNAIRRDARGGPRDVGLPLHDFVCAGGRRRVEGPRQGRR